MKYKTLNSNDQKVPKQATNQKITENVDKTAEVDRRTWLHVPSRTHWSTSSDTHQVVEIQIETSTMIYTPF